ncbi:hypothetical protein HY638_02255 [Candidatus Woesearchaeota archaeon]|nr:hypothetical protein [Candidatus Woesearchaeota archaeon]
MYPKWEDVALTEEEEREVEKLCRVENIRLMKECIEDAKHIIDAMELKRFQTNLVEVGIALFEKRASHSVYWKENRAKDKFSK